LTSRKKQYSFYRDKLLSFDDEAYQVEWKTLLEVSKKITSGGTPDRSNSLYYGGSIPWLRTQEVDFREIYDTELGITEEGLANSSSKWIEKNAVIVAMYGATAAKVGIAKIPLTTNQACCNIEIDENIANYRYVYYWLTYNYETLKSMGQGSQSNINAGIIKSFKIPVPSLEIQSRIVQVLDNFDTVCNDLNIGLPKEIELRQKQYEYFREKLLTFVAEGEYTESRVEEWDNSAIIKLLQWVFGPIRVKVGQVVNLQSGKRLVRKQLTTSGSVPVYQNSLAPLGYYTESNRVKNTSFVICAGAAGEVGYSAVDFWAADDVYTLATSDNISDKFMYYVLLSKQDRLKSQVRKASIPRLSKDAIDKVTFYLPPFSEQKRIVSILDNFNTLTNSISEGLPKEIELRQKQYEYWREQLLNFTR
jgi:putative type I restriction-modification system, specificity determinant